MLPTVRNETSRRCVGPSRWSYTQLPRTVDCHSGVVKVALECLVWMIRLPHEKDLIGPKVALECLVWMIMLPHEKDLIGPRKKARLPQKPVSMLKPVLKSLWNG